MFIQMKVKGLLMDPQTNTPIVILKDPGSEQSLPIWIGLLEATSIATEIENIQFPRPMTHDLIKSLMDQLSIEVERVEVSDLRENTYFAIIYLRAATGELISIDARPSDAIAIALRANAPIFVNEDVLAMSREADIPTTTQTVFDRDSKEQWAEVLANLDPDDFGKYKM